MSRMAEAVCQGAKNMRSGFGGNSLPDFRCA
jgi:hypothetical protein